VGPRFLVRYDLFRSKGKHSYVLDLYGGPQANFTTRIGSRDAFLDWKFDYAGLIGINALFDDIIGFFIEWGVGFGTKQIGIAVRLNGN